MKLQESFWSITSMINDNRAQFGGAITVYATVKTGDGGGTN